MCLYMCFILITLNLRCLIHNYYEIVYVISVAGSNNAYNLQQQKTNMAAAKTKEKEEEKRRLQAEMRRREQELLNKIKEQQKMLESMKHEKSKVKFKIVFNFEYDELKNVILNSWRTQ